MTVFLPWKREWGEKTSMCEIVGKGKRLVSHQGPDCVVRKERMLRAGADGRLECWNLQRMHRRWQLDRKAA